MAATALDTVDQELFTVVPAEWSRAVIYRGRRLSTGAAPQVPAIG